MKAIMLKALRARTTVLGERLTLLEPNDVVEVEPDHADRLKIIEPENLAGLHLTSGYAIRAFTMHQAAKMLKRHYMTIWRYKKEGRFPNAVHVPEGGASKGWEFLIPETDLQAAKKRIQQHG